MLNDGPTGVVVDEYFKLLQKQQKELGEKCRQSYQKAIITKVLLGSSPDTLGEIAHCQMNGDLYVRIYFHINEPIDDAVFTYVIIDYEQRHIVGCNTRITEKQVGRLDKDGFIEFHIPRLPLTNGKYSISPGVFERVKHSSDLIRIDHHNYVDCIEVGLVNMPGWKFSDGFYQSCFVPYEWKIEH